MGDDVADRDRAIVDSHAHIGGKLGKRGIPAELALIDEAAEAQPSGRLAARGDHRAITGGDGLFALEVAHSGGADGDDLPVTHGPGGDGGCGP